MSAVEGDGHHYTASSVQWAWWTSLLLLLCLAYPVCLQKESRDLEGWEWVKKR